MLTLSRLPNVRATLLTASAMAAFCFAEPAAAQAADAAPSQATPTAPAQPTTDKDKTTAAPAPAYPDTTAANASTGSTGVADIVVTASGLALLGGFIILAANLVALVAEPQQRRRRRFAAAIPSRQARARS
jgi:hypothetical protein